MKITGNRPMKQLESNMFRDIVDGQMVHLYGDNAGNTWYATSPWSLFRVRVETQQTKVL